MGVFTNKCVAPPEYLAGLKEPTSKGTGWEESGERGEMKTGEEWRGGRGGSRIGEGSVGRRGPPFHGS